MAQTGSRSPARSTLGAALLATVALLAASCSTSSTSSTGKLAGTPAPACTTPPPAAAVTAGTPSGSWPYPNAELDNARVATGSVISSANVSELQQAWTFKLTGQAAASVKQTGSLAANPVVINGVVYLQDLDANVYAIELATGKLKWEYQVGSPEASGPGPDGVAVACGVVYGDTSTAVFALNAATGQPYWADSALLGSGQGKFEIQPEVADGRLYLASAYGDGPGGGVLLALNSSTGSLLWSFDTVPGQDSAVRGVGLGSGGAWEPPLVGSDGSVTFGIGNPYQSPATAIADPSALLYTDSVVNLDAATGKLRWYYQGVPDDFKDWDLQASPVSAAVAGTPVVIGSGKVGYVYAMNAQTGKLLWKTPVGQHNGHDNDSVQALNHDSTLTAPLTSLPGTLGGVLTNVALADGSIYLATIDVGVVWTKLTQIDGGAGTGVPESGEIEALSVATGKVEWDTKVPSIPLGAATVANDLVFTALENGVLIALNRATGAIVYRHTLPTSTNAPIAIAGNTVLVPAGGPRTSTASGRPQLVAYAVP
jgi:alcohol dehydrogenase (cytochrome c)